MKKIITWISIVMFIGIAIYFVYSNNKYFLDETKDNEEDENVTLTIMAPSKEIFSVEKRLMTDYEKYSGNKIEFQEVPVDQYSGVLKTKIAAGNAPDIAVIWPSINVAQFFPDENFVDLSNEEWVKRQTETARKSETFNNKIIGFGMDGESYGWGIFYNKDLFNAYGLEVPNNMESMLRACKILKSNGIIPFAGAFKENWTFAIMMGNMGNIANKEINNFYYKLNNGGCTFSDSTVFLNYIEDFKKLYQGGYIEEDSFSYTLNDALLKVYEGKVAMSLANNMPEARLGGMGINVFIDDFGMFPIPLADNNSLCLYEGGFIRAISVDSVHIEVCKDFFKFLSLDENLERCYKVNERKYNTPGFKKHRSDFQRGDFEQDLINNSDGTTEVIAESGIIYWESTVYGNILKKAIVGDISAMDALNEIDEIRKRMFDATE